MAGPTQVSNSAGLRHDLKLCNEDFQDPLLVWDHTFQNHCPKENRPQSIRDSTGYFSCGELLITRSSVSHIRRSPPVEVDSGKMHLEQVLQAILIGRVTARKSRCSPHGPAALPRLLRTRWALFSSRLLFSLAGESPAFTPVSPSGLSVSGQIMPHYFF